MTEPCTQDARLVRIENKIDTLLEFKFKISGGWIWISVLTSVLFSIVTMAISFAQFLS